MCVYNIYILITQLQLILLLQERDRFVIESDQSFHKKKIKIGSSRFELYSQDKANYYDYSTYMFSVSVDASSFSSPFSSFTTSSVFFTSFWRARSIAEFTCFLNLAFSTKMFANIFLSSSSMILVSASMLRDLSMS